MSAFSALITKAEAIIHDITGQARADLARVVADLKAATGESRTIIQARLETARTELAAAVASAGPQVVQDAADLLAKLEADILKALG